VSLEKINLIGGSITLILLIIIGLLIFGIYEAGQEDGACQAICLRKDMERYWYVDGECFCFPATCGEKE